jgi:hypothetical protein
MTTRATRAGFQRVRQLRGMSVYVQRVLGVHARSLATI